MKRLTHYEFWPFWVFYIPAYFYYFWLALKSRKWVYFSVLNPCMNFGGAMLSSKQNHLKQLPKKWKPQTLYFEPSAEVVEVYKLIQKAKLNFPLIVKPDMGERGKNVALISSFDDLKIYIQKATYAILIQEYIDYPIELGILFYWDKNKNPKISSIGLKGFCEIYGTGKDSMKSLIEQNHRISHRIAFFKAKYIDLWETILPKDKKILLEPIGNHHLGTIFFDARKYYSTEMLNWTAECVRHIQGFDYGRLDIKIKNWDAFTSKKGIKVLEVNGVNAEPIHIYDPNYSIWHAYSDIFRHMNIIYDLSKKKIKQKKKTQSLYDFYLGSRKVLKAKNVTQI